MRWERNVPGYVRRLRYILLLLESLGRILNRDVMLSQSCYKSDGRVEEFKWEKPQGSENHLGVIGLGKIM